MKITFPSVYFKYSCDLPHLDQYNPNIRTVPRQVSGTKLFFYFDEFLVTMGTKFGYTSFMKVVIPEV